MTTTIVHPSSRRLWELAERQHGVVTRQQLLAADLTDAAIRHRLAIGRLHALRRGVYAVGRPQTSREGTWLAALLSCGAHSALSHASGLALCRVRSGLGPQVIDVSVPRQLRRRQPNVRLHRLKRGTEEIRIRDGIPVLSPARLLLNAAATVSIQQLERDINIADAQGLISVDALGRAIRGFRHEPGVAALRAVVLGHTFTLTDSELERIFLPVARSAELPDPLTRRYVNGFRVDFFWPDLGLVVETDGLRYHRTPAQQAKDLFREQTHKAAGVEALRFTHHQVAYQRPWVRSTLTKVAARLRGRSPRS
ncbi:MAG: type IV toxin-antitoxin system AbiEi family antitoxin domain-containing protein [Thermoleophilaceae bacterium]